MKLLSLLSLRRVRLTAVAVALGASALLAGSALPASAATSTTASTAAASFTPLFWGNFSMNTYGFSGEGGCLNGGNGGFTVVFLEPTIDCTEDIPTSLQWGIYTTPFGGLNLKNVANGQCLDSNASGSVYTDPCNWNNEYQSFTFGGQGVGVTIQSQATSLCMNAYQPDGEPAYGYSVNAIACNWNNLNENWEAISA
jgi:hypothetical protein